MQNISTGDILHEMPNYFLGKNEKISKYRLQFLFTSMLRKYYKYTSCFGIRLGRGWGCNGDNFCTGVRAILNLPHSYTWPLKKTDPFIIWNVDPFIYFPLIFLYPFISQFIEYQENKQPQKCLSENMCIYRDVRKSGAFHIPIKIWSVIYFLLKKCCIVAAQVNLKQLQFWSHQTFLD